MVEPHQIKQGQVVFLRIFRQRSCS